MKYWLKTASLIAVMFMITGSAIFTSCAKHLVDEKTVIENATNENIEQQKTYKIGDRGPAGGWIFYDKGKTTDGWRYLEASPEDLGTVEWGCFDKSISGAKGTAIGTGKSNTQAILDSCDYEYIAAKLCTEYRGGGKNDWFLPSKNELELIYKNLYKKGAIGFAANYFWSSSEYSAGEGIVYYFGTGIQYNIDKFRCLRVRAVRAF